MLVFSCATSRELGPKIFALVKAVYRECAIMHNHTVIVLVFKGSKNACEVIHRRDLSQSPLHRGRDSDPITYQHPQRHCPLRLVTIPSSSGSGFGFTFAMWPQTKSYLSQSPLHRGRDSDGVKMLAFKGVAGIQKNFFGESIPATSLILLETLGVST